jgi:hypothetical protein
MKIEDADGGLAGLKRVFECWREIHCRYHGQVSLPRRDGDRERRADCIWWTTERGNVGALAAAAWLARAPAVEEYRDCAVQPRERVDMWMQLDGASVHVEAKMHWLDLKDLGGEDTMLAGIEDELSRIEKESARIQGCERHLALVFVVPYGIGLTQEAATRHLGAVVKPMSSPRHVQAWFGVDACVPHWEGPDHPGHYPGVLMVGQVTERPFAGRRR